MRFMNALQSAVFLRRKSQSIIEADYNATKINIFCPNSSRLENCAVLGSRIWYSPPVYAPCYVPPIWQLLEVDLGQLVLVNDKLCSYLFIEGLSTTEIRLDNKVIHDLVVEQDATLFKDYSYDFRVQDVKNDINYFVNITGSSYNIYNKAENVSLNLFPEPNYADMRSELYDLIHAKQLGYNAILCCFILNSGVEKLCLTDVYDKQYADLLKTALKNGVKLMGYSISVYESEIKIDQSISIDDLEF